MSQFGQAHAAASLFGQARGYEATVESVAAQAALLQHVSIGTDATTALAVLSAEGLSCKKQPATSDEQVECGFHIPSDIRSGLSICNLVILLCLPLQKSPNGTYLSSR